MRCLNRLESFQQGELRVLGTDVSDPNLNGRQLRRLRARARGPGAPPPAPRGCDRPRPAPRRDGGCRDRAGRSPARPRGRAR
ncbi:MAG: hypothetical protein ACO3CS_16770 [Alphaproteobacteria bacterium]